MARREGMAREEYCHGCEHHECADCEEQFRRHVAEYECTEEASYSTEYEVESGGETCIFQWESETFHEDFRGDRVGAHVNSHVAHYAEEAKEDER